jgi:dipeptidase E
VSGAIVGMGGGGFSEEPDNPLLDRFVLSLAGRERPRVCFVATASGDSEGYVARFYRAWRPAHSSSAGPTAPPTSGRCRRATWADAPDHACRREPVA